MRLLILTLCFGSLHHSVISKRPNVLFLMADDMRPNVEFLRGDILNGFTSPRMHTPNIDALAARSLVLKQAFVQQAICAPSRASLLTGRRPDTTHVYAFKNYWRESGGNFTTIPQYFKENGYTSVGIGKIFHGGKSSNNNDPISWSAPYFEGDFNFESHDKIWDAIPDDQLVDKPLVDEQIADEAISRLRYFSAASGQKDAKPFFLAVGFHKPHLPFVFPESMLDKYPMSDINVPDNDYPPFNMPSIAGRFNHIFKSYRDLRAMNISGGIDSVVPDLVVRQLRRAYYCALSWADIQLGRVLDELDNLGLSDDTLVSFISDHGYELGEHNMWTKFSNFELALRTLMMVHIPGTTSHMIQTEQMVEFVDLFPTLVEATGFDPLTICPEDSSNVKLCREGMSFIPLIANPETPIKRGSFSQAKRARKVMGYSVRTSRYRYTEWVRFNKHAYMPKWRRRVGEELYDHFLDSEENFNVAMDSDYFIVKERLRLLLHGGWRVAHYPDDSTANEKFIIDSELIVP